MNDTGQAFTYDAAGNQVTAGSISEMKYDASGLRIKKTENGGTTYYVRSSVLGGQILAEVTPQSQWLKGYVYSPSGQTVAIQDVPNNRVLWLHQEPYAKAQRISDSSGAFVAGVELDPFGGETNRSFDNSGLAVNQRRRYTSYDRDANGSDEALHRRYARWHGRFDQPDPYDGSADVTNPQSLNRYAYVQNDPVNFVDPSGLNAVSPGTGSGSNCSYNWTATGHYVGNDLVGVSDFHGSVTCYGGGGGGGEIGGGQDDPTFGLGAPPVYDINLVRAQALLRQTNCGNFIRNLLSQAGSIAPFNNSYAGGLITPQFGSVSDLTGNQTSNYNQFYAVDEYQRALNGGRISASGNSGTNGNVVTYGTTTNNTSISWNNEFYSLGRDDAARQILHESLHLLANFSDFVLANAAHMLASQNRDNPNGRAGNFANRSAASIYLNQQIGTHCR